MPVPTITDATPISTLLQTVTEFGQHFRFDKRALYYKGQSGVNHATGKSNGFKAKGQDLSFKTSLNRHSGDLLIRDKSTQRDAFDQAFDWRRVKVFQFPRLVHIPSISVYYNAGRQWIEYSLEGRRFWMSPPSDEAGIREFIQLEEECFAVEARRNFLKNRLTNLRKKLSDKAHHYFDDNGQGWRIAKEAGVVEAVVDKEGNEIKKEARKIESANLFVQPVLEKPKFDKLEANDDKDIIRLQVEYYQLGERYRSLKSCLRPIELGLVEDLLSSRFYGSTDLSDLDETTIQFGELLFSVSVKDDRIYDLPADTGKKLENGEYMTVTRKSSRATWTTKKIDITFDERDGEEVPTVKAPSLPATA